MLLIKEPSLQPHTRLFSVSYSLCVSVSLLQLPSFLLSASVLVLFPRPPFSSPTGDSGNWIEIAYGTSSGVVRVIVQHPETVGSGLKLFQTFSVHRSPVTKIMLSEKHLISGGSAWRARSQAFPGGSGGETALWR